MSYNNPQWFKYAGFENIGLQDSCVLQIKTDPQVEFIIDAVLAPQHPLYTGPKPGEWADFKPMKIIFPNSHQLKWLDWNVQLIYDADGNWDYGELDDFYLVEGTSDHYIVEAEWGTLDFFSDPPVIGPIEVAKPAQFPPPTRPSYI